MPELPEFVAPMLAKRGPAFDSDDHVFEIKWDGIRAITLLDESGLRGFTRNRNELTARYPELECLRALPPGVVLDGELVALLDGRPDFETVLRREQARDPERIAGLVRSVPITYIVFDVMYVHYESVCDEPLRTRRDLLEQLCDSIEDSRILMSDGIVGGGRAYFDSACERGLEGVVAKRLDSRYLPGRRTDAWTKCKRTQLLHCVILGYLPSEDDPNDFKSLVVGAQGDDGALRVVGRVGSGIRTDTRARLNHELRAQTLDAPIVPSTEAAVWVEPTLFCKVSFLEFTRGGTMRAPVFEGLVDDGG